MLSEGQKDSSESIAREVGENEECIGRLPKWSVDVDIRTHGGKGQVITAGVALPVRTLA
jgi:hypothetical protein